ncbi:hypothetical protein [Nostoc sp. DSM 114167]|jgi:hypothetical protein|uniref:hypothetical protein n=1 Tax=Nostoc sp. DSM 114167 TaxID=3439050 RepID=UPI0040455948
MPLPEGFSEWENLQDLVRLDHNKAVTSYFKNQEDNDISTPKARLKHTCLIKDEDTATMTLMRMWLFEVTCGHAQALQRPVYGVPVYDAQTDRTFKPQIKLYFLEAYDHETHGDGLPQLEGEITFRLMTESSETISRSDAERLARNIKNIFATPPLVWSKGHFKATYTDETRGYNLRLLVSSKAEAESTIRSILEIQEHPFERDFFQYIENDRTYSLSPGTHRVYSRTVKKPIKRRRADVKFRYAQLLIWGQPNPVNLVSVGGTRLRSVIERVG